MSLEMFGRILQQVQSSSHTMQFYFQGEPLLNKQLSEMITMAHKVGLYTIVSTNAQVLNRSTAEALVKSGLNRIIVSVDGFSEESYDAYRVGGSLHRALEGLRYLREAKAACGSGISIELQVLRLRSNEHEWEWIKHNYRSLGATRLVFKTAQLHDYQDGHPLMPSDERYSRYKKEADGSYHLSRSLFHRFVATCYRLWSGCVITTEGEVLPCCYDKSGRYCFGSLKDQSILDVWHNKKADAFRRQVLQKSNKIPICKECGL